MNPSSTKTIKLIKQLLHRKKEVKKNKYKMKNSLIYYACFHQINVYFQTLLKWKNVERKMVFFWRKIYIKKKLCSFIFFCDGYDWALRMVN
jgi:hypothetical protein